MYIIKKHVYTYIFMYIYIYLKKIYKIVFLTKKGREKK